MAALDSEQIKNVHVLIMAGGSGTRFWPKSRKKKPKQLLGLWDDTSLLEHTIKRFSSMVSPSNIWVVTTEALIAPSKEVLSGKYSEVNFLGEPEGKNTAACIFWGVREIEKKNPNAVVAVMPADHFIGKEMAFLKGIEVAVSDAVKNETLVTLGIKPSGPDTGFGYIEVNEDIKSTKSEVMPVQQFVEKPDLNTAKKYFESGKYLWNAGMFIFSVKTAIDSFKKCAPSLVDVFDAHGSIDKVYSHISKNDSVSFDYAVMEKAGKHGVQVKVVPVDCGWNDVGSFTALEDIQRATLGDIVSLDAKGNIIQSDEGLVALLGVDDLVVVRDKDVVLVAKKDRAQDIKALLDRVKIAHPEKL